MLMGEPGTQIPEFVTKHKLGGVVTDFSPLRVPQDWVQKVGDNLPENVPLCQVGEITDFVKLQKKLM